MHAHWKIDKASLAKWRQLVEDNRHKALPRRRYLWNVKRQCPALTEQWIWTALIGCQVTTQQKSGQGTSVDNFLKSSSPALNVERCRRTRDLYALLVKELERAKLRRSTTIAENLVEIMSHLEAGEWQKLLCQLETISKRTDWRAERAVVDYLLKKHEVPGTSKSRKRYPGLGPKQARNFVQWLGLSRHEVPIDSRVLKKMKEFGTTFLPSGAALGDEAVYVFVQDGLQQIAESLAIYPCILDACIFASFDITSDGDAGEPETQS